VRGHPRLPRLLDFIQLFAQHLGERGLFLHDGGEFGEQDFVGPKSVRQGLPLLGQSGLLRELLVQASSSARHILSQKLLVLGFVAAAERENRQDAPGHVPRCVDVTGPQLSEDGALLWDARPELATSNRPVLHTSR